MWDFILLNQSIIPYVYNEGFNVMEALIAMERMESWPLLPLMELKSGFSACLIYVLQTDEEFKISNGLMVIQ